MSKRKVIKQGGARKGAGRKKTKEETVVMRVPVSLVESIRQLIQSKQAC